jgi:hypothetical protein
MSLLTTIFKALMNDKNAFNIISGSPKWNKWGVLVLLILGMIYGTIFLTQYREVINAEFDTDLFRTYLVPGLILLIGLGMVFLTRIALTLLLWAAARGFGGAGLLGSIYRSSIFALVPSILTMPAFIATTAQESVSTIQIALALIGLVWMFFLCVRVLEATQNFVTWKAYSGVVAVFIFFLSILYIVTPPAI